MQDILWHIADIEIMKSFKWTNGSKEIIDIKKLNQTIIIEKNSQSKVKKRIITRS